jgi:copper chaperone CopZ
MKTILSYVSGILVAVFASACCWIPALLGAGAAGSLGISSRIAPFRPYLLILTAVFLAGGFYFAYRKSREECCQTPEALKKRKLNIGVMWVIAALSVAAAAYPNLAALGQTPQVASAASTNERTVVLHVPGIDCAACAGPIREALAKTSGVKSASVDVDKKSATVVVNASFHDTQHLLDAVKSAGFDATEENGHAR